MSPNRTGRSATEPTGPLAAVLFDLDGTLVDTEPYWFAAEHRMVAEHGGTWSDEHAHALVGSDLLHAAHYIREVSGVALTEQQIVAYLISDVMDSCRRQIPWRPGAPELLAACRAAEVPTALVTMSYRSLADIVIAALPDPAFDTVVTGEQVAHGKPHPEPYLQACARLGVDPGASVAIEDSPPGVASAVAAGCWVIAVPNTVPIPPAPRVRVVESLSGLDVAALQGCW